MTTYVLGEFDSGRGLLEAITHLREHGYTDLDGYSPYPLEGAEHALGLARSRIPFFVLVAGLSGATLGYLMMYWCNAVDYPLNVGGRPLNSYPAFIPITFELGILFAASTCLVAFLVFCRLPRLYHPVFEVEGFRRAAVDTFWVSIKVPEASAASSAMGELGRLAARNISNVEVP